MKKLIFGLLCFTALIAYSQAARTKSKFKIGMAETEMYARIGQPASYLCVHAQKYITQKQYPAWQDRDTCRPVYRRKTKINEYEVIVFLQLDSARIRRAIRVAEVRFVMGHDMTVDEALADIPEASEACGPECHISQGVTGFLGEPGEGNMRLSFDRTDDPRTDVSGSTPIKQLVIYRHSED